MENNDKIDLQRIWKIIKSKIIIIAFIIALSVMACYQYSYCFKKPQYKSSVKILLVVDEVKESQGITQQDINLNSGLISTYSSIATSNNVIEEVIKNLDLDISINQLKNNLAVKQIGETQCIEITVKDYNAETAKIVANEIAEVFSKKVKEIYNIQNINIVDAAEIEGTPINMNHINDIISFLGIRNRFIYFSNSIFLLF